jgi:hypothetical protein
MGGTAPSVQVSATDGAQMNTDGRENQDNDYELKIVRL